MWTMLIDWLHEVCSTFELHDNTLFMAVQLLHTALRHVPPITPSRFQLYGVTALFMACKYEEVLSPELRDFVYISDDCCTRAQILATEAEILRLHWPIFGTLYERMINLDSTEANRNALIAISRYDVWDTQSDHVADACLHLAMRKNLPRTRSATNKYGDLIDKLMDHSHLPESAARGIRARISAS